MSKRYKSNFDYQFVVEKPVLGVNYRTWHKWSLVKLVDYLLTDAATYHTIYEQTGSKQLADTVQSFMPHQKYKQNASIVLHGFAEARNDIFLQPEVRAVIAKIITYYDFRQRDISTWKAPSRNVYRQAMSLVRHLFDKYGNCPEWLINAWFKSGMEHRVSLPELMIHIGDGKSFRQYKMPVEVTKKLETALRQAPEESSLMEAIRYAQLANRNALEWFTPLTDR